MSLSRGLENKAKYALWNILGPLLSFARRKPALPIDLKKIQSALVVRPDRLGDVILSTPVYASIKKSIPEARVTALVDRANTELLRDNPYIDEIIELDPKTPWNALPNLMRNSYDLALTLNKKFSSTASLLTFFSGAALRVGYDHPESAWVHDIRIPVTGKTQHETENNLDLLRALDVPEIAPSPQIFFDPGEKKKVELFLMEKRVFPERPLVLIKPGARVAEWGWSLEKFQTVADHLAEEGLAETFVIRGPDEDGLIDAFVGGMKHKPVVLPLLPLKELAMAVKLSSLLFCNHTGIMHLASAVQTPVLAIFKHGEIRRWGPITTRNIVLEERDDDDLEPAKVIENILRLLLKPS